jgi:hypothetical protein
MQGPVPFQPWDNMRDHDQMRQSGIGAGLPGVTAHLDHLASGDRRCCIQDSDRCPLQDMGDPLSNPGNRIYDAWEIGAVAQFLRPRLDNVKYHAEATRLTGVPDGQVHALEAAIFQQMLTQGCLGDLKSSALQLGDGAEAHVSDRVVSQGQTHRLHQWHPMVLGCPFYSDY